MSTRARFENRNVVILGLARQGLALARYFVAQQARVTVSDRAQAAQLRHELNALGNLPVALELGDHPSTLLDDCDLLCLSGGVPPQIEIVQEAIRRGVPLSNDALLTLQLARAQGLGPIVAITGSSGKTTTTTLVSEMLRNQGLTTHTGGNIGVPLIDRLDDIGPGEPIVLELSSFQLELFDPAVSWGDLDHIGPDVGAILNLTPNHLDRHADMVDYAAAKLNLLAYLPENATVVLNADDPVTARLLSADGALALPKGWGLDELLDQRRDALAADDLRRLGFSTRGELGAGAWQHGDRLLLDGSLICRRGEVQLRGEHNVANVLAAAVISKAAGAELDAIRQAAQTFCGVPHRLEVVATQDGVTWINDSIATSPERAIAALRSFNDDAATLILLAGGKDKQLPWELFTDEVIARVNMLIGFGDAGPMIVRTVRERAATTRRTAPNCALAQRLEEAVELAGRAAVDNTVILLSPGGTSYDAYKDFEERGEHFRSLVDHQLQSTIHHASMG